MRSEGSARWRLEAEATTRTVVASADRAAEELQRR